MAQKESVFYRGAVCTLTIFYYLSATAPFWWPGADLTVFPLAFLLYYTLLTLLGAWSARRTDQAGAILWLTLAVPMLLSLSAVLLSLLCYPVLPIWRVGAAGPVVSGFQSALPLFLRGYAWGGWAVTLLAVNRCLQIRPVKRPAYY